MGVFLFMGIYPNPNYRMYWSQNAPNTLVKSALNGGVNRFEQLKRFLHFNNNQSKPDDCKDKLYKVRPLIEALLGNCNSIEPEEYNSVDGQIIPTKGKSSLKQCLPKKPHKWGYKVFSRCGRGVSGIIYEFEIYQGKGETKSPPSPLGVTGDLVVRLCKILPKHENYKLYCDNFFTSLPLIEISAIMEF